MSVDEYQTLAPYAKELETNLRMLTYDDVCCADAGRPPGQLNSDGANLLVYGTLDISSTTGLVSACDSTNYTLRS